MVICLCVKSKPKALGAAVALGPLSPLETFTSPLFGHMYPMIPHYLKRLVSSTLQCLLPRCAHAMQLVCLTQSTVLRFNFLSSRAQCCTPLCLCLYVFCTNTNNTSHTCTQSFSSLQLCSFARVFVQMTYLLIRIKWPNDVLCDGKKISGMLINIEDAACIGGVGLNVNQVFDGDDELASTATSLKVETEIEHDRESLLATFCYQLESLMRKPWKDVLDEYKSLNALHGLSVRVYHNQRLVDDERDFTAKVVGIADSGELLVKNEETGAVQTISGQEISIRPKTTA
eukprot:m.138468 g.138468  ORF g.138468 m.138468 type:complete len:286 (-) comp14011_c1_seq28:516-1373(-)